MELCPLMAKLTILTAEERQIFDAPPKLTVAERNQVFQLPEPLQILIQRFDTAINQIGFILVWGYCKYSGRFFLPKTFYSDDIAHVSMLLTLDIQPHDIERYNEKTYRNHKQIVREHLQLSPFNDASNAVFQEAIRERVTKHQLPKQILADVTQLLRIQQIEIPGYNRFALAITDAMVAFEKEILMTVKKQLSDTQREMLDALLELDADTQLSRLVQLKSVNHSKKPTAIRKSVLDFRFIQILYQTYEPIIRALNLYNDTIKHYANWIRKSSLQQVRQLAEPKRYLYLLAFIAHHYRIRQDLLSDMLLACVQATENAVAKEQKNRISRGASVQHQTLQLLTEARISYKDLLNQIQQVVKSSLLSDTDKVQKINALIDKYKKNSTTDPQLDTLQKQAIEDRVAQNYYVLLESSSIKLQNRVADSMKYLSFDSTMTQAKVWAAIQHYQAKSGAIGKEAPRDFLTDEQNSALFDGEGKFRVSLYKALLFSHVAATLKSGAISLAPSYRYLTIDAYLYSPDYWQQHKERLLTQAGFTHFQSFQDVMSMLAKSLHEQYNETNQHIKLGKNTHIKFDSKEKMILNTPKIEKPNVQSTSTLFTDRKHVSILQVLSEVNQVSDYLSCFTHQSVKDKKILPRKEVFYAAILGQGCNIGISKMANVSKGISEDILEHLINWHFNLDNIHAANNKLLALIEQLSLSTLYQKDPAHLHTSSDGRKVGVAVESLNANYSFKYFGSGIGSAVYSFIDERNRLFYSTVLSSSEREAAYVIDGLLHNLAIKSTIHSTDTHGYSEVVFGVMHVLGIFFAPRIKNLKHSTLYSFEPKKTYEAKGYKILPERYIDTQLIETHWDAILRLMTTIQLKETPASQIFKRLSSYSRQHPLYCALKEFGRIIKSLFILRYIDEVELRQAIEKQLNRVELANKFSKAILFGNNQEIQHSSKEEQELVVSCQRFIQNAIVLWNELYLSQQLASQGEPERDRILNIIKNGSTMVWQHVNLQGEYDFTQDVANHNFDMDKILALQVA
jgi:TnpA family transposase